MSWLSPLQTDELNCCCSNTVAKLKMHQIEVWLATTLSDETTTQTKLSKHILKRCQVFWASCESAKQEKNDGHVKSLTVGDMQQPVELSF